MRTREAFNIQFLVYTCPPKEFMRGRGAVMLAPLMADGWGVDVGSMRYVTWRAWTLGFPFVIAS